MGRLYTREELLIQRALWKQQGRRVVFTNGCYDLLHPGHIRLLEHTRSLGDLLILALNTDDSVRRLKGPGRPRILQEDRMVMLAGLEVVDYVVCFEDDTPTALLEALRPQILVKGAAYRDGVVVGREVVEGYGGRIAFVPELQGFSTSTLLAADGLAE